MSSGILSAQTSEYLAVQLSADVKANPPEITLRWKRITYGLPYYLVYRKTKTSSSWGTALDSLYNERTVFSDLNVIADSAYEYKVEARGTFFTSTGYIYSGINFPAIHNRGILILLVDDIFSDSCSAEISTLMNDLSGDGWQIIRHDLSRSATDVEVKAVISDDYNTNDNVKSVFILGHIAVPYSGNKAFDSHENHQGAWPADLFYSNMNSDWSDNSVNNSYSIYLNNKNIPGDGKWDQTWISSESQLQIGRVDFYDMPAFANSEIQLMKNYLFKDHYYKLDLLNIRRRGLIYDGLGINSNEAFAANGWRNFSPLLGKDSITVVGYYQTIPALVSTAYQWAYGCGGGTFTSLNHIGSTSDFVNNPNNSIFTMFFGSGFGDWNTTNNFMRAALCSNPPALTSCWVGRPNWYFHHMSLGENIGYSALITQNNSALLYNNNNKPLYSTEINSNNGGVHVALLGDPTLRSDYIKPLSNLSINASQENLAGLNWVDSPDPEVIGYYVYSSESLHGFYQKLSIDMLTETTYTDSAVNNETKYYMVRPAKLQTNASGSYYNLGIGIIDSFYSNAPVNNVTKNTSHSDIQSAVNAASNGDVIELDPGTYNEQVLINKEITIKNSGAKPVIDFTGTPSLVSGKLTLFEITVPNVTIDSIEFNVDLAKIGSAIIASAQDVNNLTIKNNDVNPYKSGNVISFGLRNAVNINYGSYRINGSNPSNIIAENNIISYNYYGTPQDPSDDAGFRSGFATDESGGTFNLNTIQTISQDIEARFCSSGDINITNNIINGGGVNLAEYNAGAGNIIVMGNVFDGSMGNIYSSSLRLKNNLEMKTTFVSGNTFLNHNWGISLENYSSVIIDSNIFTPAANSNVYRHITVNTKLLNTSSATVTQTAIDGTFTNNTFNSSGTPGGTGLAFYNHDSDNDSYGTFTIGSAGNENNFNSGMALFIALDPSTGPSWPSAFSENNLGAPAITAMACWDKDLNVEYNNFDVGAGLQLPSEMLNSNLFMLEDKIQHKIDDPGIGLVTVKTNNVYVTVNSFVSPETTTPSVQRGIDAASAGFIVNIDSGNYTEQIEIYKDLTIAGQGRSVTNIISPDTLTLSYTTSDINKPVIYVHDAEDVTLKDLTVDGAGKGNANVRFQGIGYRNAGGTVRNCEIKTIRNSIIDSAQAGVGFYAYADDGIARTLSFLQNNVFDFQKNATVFAGADLSAKIDSNTITGAGAVNLIAQNGIQLCDGASGSIRFNTINSLSFTPATYVSSGILLFQSSGQDTTSNNILTDCQMGIYYFDAGGVIRENTINSSAVNNGTASYWGINTGTGGALHVKIHPADGQDFDGNGMFNSSNSPDTVNTYIFRNTLTSDGTNGTGIEMDVLGMQTLNVTVLENNVTGWNTAVLFYSDSGATLIGTVNENNLSNNTYALYNLTDVIQNCTCNWFGTFDSDTIASKISGTINSSPYLTNGIDSNDIEGYQPVSGSCNGLSATTLNIKVIQEGYYNSGTKTLNKIDTVKAYLHLNFFPYSVIDSAKSTIDSVTFTGSFSFSQPNGTYYIVIKNRNTIETWSRSGGETFTAGTIMNYDFTDAITKAYHNNLVQIDNLPDRFALFSGDLNQDGIIDAADISNDENDVLNAVSGYVSSDITGDEYVDASDLSIIENNSINNVILKKP